MSLIDMNIATGADYFCELGRSDKQNIGAWIMSCSVGVGKNTLYFCVYITDFFLLYHCAVCV